jgi:hypothetical protein
MDDFDERDISLDYIAGVEDMRVLFFEELRALIQEKDASGDDIATAVLGWAYERLGEMV